MVAQARLLQLLKAALQDTRGMTEVTGQVLQAPLVVMLQWAEARLKFTKGLPLPGVLTTAC